MSNWQHIRTPHFCDVEQKDGDVERIIAPLFEKRQFGKSIEVYYVGDTLPIHILTLKKNERWWGTPKKEMKDIVRKHLVDQRLLIQPQYLSQLIDRWFDWGQVLPMKEDRIVRRDTLSQKEHRHILETVWMEVEEGVGEGRAGLCQNRLVFANRYTIGKGGVLWTLDRQSQSRKELKNVVREDEIDLIKAALFKTEYEEQIRLCMDFLRPLKHMKTMNKHSTSYNFKHDVEYWYERMFNKHVYISNGAFIVAAIYMGFDWQVEFLSTDMFFNLSTNNIEKVWGKR